MPTVRFRLLLVVSLALGISSWFVDYLVPDLVPAPVVALLAERPQPFSSLPQVPLLLVLVVGFSAWLVSIVGLWLFKPWARPLALWSFAVAVSTHLLWGPTVSSGWSSALLEASAALWGAVLALAYVGADRWSHPK